MTEEGEAGKISFGKLLDMESKWCRDVSLSKQLNSINLGKLSYCKEKSHFINWFLKPSKHFSDLHLGGDCCCIHFLTSVYVLERSGILEKKVLQSTSVKNCPLKSWICANVVIL